MGHTIVLRESTPPGQVVIFVNGDMVHAENEYRGAANWIKREYGLNNIVLRAIHADYKADYDRRFP